MSYEGNGSGGSSKISTSADVALNGNPTDDQVLTFDGDLGMWQNQNLSGKAVLATGGGQEATQFINSVSGAATLDISSANVLSITLSGDATLTFTGAAPNTACSFSLFVWLGGTYDITWPSSVKWPNGTAPTLTGTGSAGDLLVFQTFNGGNSWYGNLVGNSYS